MTMANIPAINHGQMDKISTMTMAKIQIFCGQNGKPFDHKITILNIDHGADSRISVAMVEFFDH